MSHQEGYLFFSSLFFEAKHSPDPWDRSLSHAAESFMLMRTIRVYVFEFS